MSMGEGGTIPFMAMLGEKFPEAQFLITGVLGPQSNAHGPNEFLHVPTGEEAHLLRRAGRGRAPRPQALREPRSSRKSSATSRSRRFPLR